MLTTSMVSKLHVLLLIFPLSLFAQIDGNVTGSDGEPLPFVNIYIEGSTLGTTSNAEGDYRLNITDTGDYEVTFQFLGYATQTVKINAPKLPHILNLKMKEAATALDEVVVDATINPADLIVQAVIDNKENVLRKQDEYTAGFYSRGLWKIQNAPKRILGQEVDLGSGLDSTRSGIVYLSETISTISYRSPNDFKEKITASKVSGDDQGFSFN
ncbi:MAG: DUF5686 family protein, partial [Leeuwenhoekiella sp.]